MNATFKMVGDWKKEIEISLSQALSATYEVTSRSLAEACKHAIILMAQSARALTEVSAKNRRIQHVASFNGRRDVILKLNQGGKPATSWFLPDKKRQPNAYADAVLKLRPIGNRGLAKRSWMWGLTGLGVKVDSIPLRGIGSLRRIQTDKVGGFILTNRLSYLLKAMPAGFRQQVEQTVTNKIMKQAQLKLARDWKESMRRWGAGSTGSGKPEIGKYIAEARA